MIKNWIASALVLTSLALPRQEAEAPSFGPDIRTLENLHSCTLEQRNLEGLISRGMHESQIQNSKRAFDKMNSTLTKYDFISSENPFFETIYSAWAENGTKMWSPEELYAVFWVESKGDFYANSHSKPEPALGPFQILESSWNSVPPYIKYFPNVYKLKPSTEKAINLLNSMYDQASILYPNWDKLTLNEKKKVVLRTYNTGIGHYQQADWIVENLSKQTQEYVPKIINEMIRNNFNTDEFLSNKISDRKVIS